MGEGGWWVGSQGVEDRATWIYPTEISGADPGRVIVAAAALPGVRGDVLPCLVVAEQQPKLAQIRIALTVSYHHLLVFALRKNGFNKIWDLEKENRKSVFVNWEERQEKELTDPGRGSGTSPLY